MRRGSCPSGDRTEGHHSGVFTEVRGLISLWMRWRRVEGDTEREWDGMTRCAGIRLPSLDFSSYGGAVIDEWLELVAEMFVRRLSLRDCLRITDDGIYALVNPGDFSYREASLLAGSLEHLDLSNCPLITGEGMQALEQFTRLESLVLDGCDLLTNIGLAHVSRGCPQLKELSFARCEKISGAGVSCLGEMTDLEALDMSECPRIVGDALTVLSELKMLRVLKLRKCVKVGNTGMPYIGELESLEQLELFGCRKVTDEGLMHLSKLKKIRHLCLTESGVTGKIVGESILPWWQGLEEIHLNRCAALASDGLNNMLQNLSTTRLRNLRIRSSPLGEEGLRTISNAFPSLTALDLSDCRSLCDGDFNIFQGSTMSQLRSLDLSGTFVSDLGLQFLLGGVPNLQELRLENCSHLEGLFLDVLSQRCKFLLQLDLSGCWRLTGSALSVITSIRTLQMLHLAGCCGVDDHWVNLACENLHQLSDLDLSKTRIGDDAITSLGSLKIRKLALKGLALLTHTGIGSMAGRLRETLEELLLDDCGKVCDDACAVLTQFRKLKVLSLTNCACVTDLGVQTLFEGLDRLESLSLRGCFLTSGDVVTDLLMDLPIRPLVVDPSRVAIEPRRRSRNSSASLNGEVYDPLGAAALSIRSFTPPSDLSSQEFAILEQMVGFDSGGESFGPFSQPGNREKGRNTPRRSRRRRRTDRSGRSDVPTPPNDYHCPR